MFIATHVSIRTSDTSSGPYEPPSQAYGTLSYRVSNPLKTLAVVLDVAPPRSTGRGFGLGRGAKAPLGFTRCWRAKLASSKL